METFKREIFEKLGNLFYAIAVGQQVSLITSGELKMAIKKDWLSTQIANDAQKVSEAAHLIGVTIDALQNDKIPASDAFADFEKFYRKNEEQFSHALKKQVLETADTVMRIFPGTADKNEYYESVKKLLYVPTGAAAR